jgi:hypothetical protein
MNRNSGNLTPIVERAHSDPPAIENAFRFPPTPASAVSPSTIEGALRQKQRLSLQVPNIVGNPVRLVTPTVLVNGEEDTAPSTGFPPSAVAVSTAPAPTFDNRTAPTHHTYHGALTPSETPAQHQPPPPPTHTHSTSPDSSLPAISLETLNRALAAELIRAPLHGRRKRLRGTEAKTLASAILTPLYPSSSPSSPVTGITIATSLGLPGSLGSTGGVRRVECIRFRVGGDGYESPIDDEDEDADERGGEVKETFDVSFAVSFGSLAGEWIAKGLSATAENVDEERGAGRAEEGAERDRPEAWKGKFLEAQRKLWESQEQVKNLKDRILEAVL